MRVGVGVVADHTLTHTPRRKHAHPRTRARMASPQSAPHTCRADAMTQRRTEADHARAPACHSSCRLLRVACCPPPHPTLPPPAGLQVNGIVNVPLLDPSEKAIMRAVMDQCCRSAGRAQGQGRRPAAHTVRMHTARTARIGAHCRKRPHPPAPFLFAQRRRQNALCLHTHAHVHARARAHTYEIGRAHV